MRGGPSRCAIYTRQSSNTDADLTSCEVQFDACRSFLEARKDDGWRWIGERFDDEGWSGATLDRPALQRLLAKIRKGELDRVLVYRLDRLSRNVVDSVVLLKELRDRDIDLVIVTSPEIGSAAHDSLVLNLLSVFAEFERDMIGRRIAEGRAALKRRGKRVGGPVPFGYDADPVTKQLAVNPEETRRVRAMFEMAAGGMLPSEIAEAANEKGWRTKTREAKRAGNLSGGNPWTSRQVLATLSNPIYLGKITNGDRLRDGVHEALVPEALFAEVRSRIEARRTRSPGRKTHKDRWPLKGLIRCARCGRVMSTHTTRHGTRIYRYYRCRSHAGGKNPCLGTQVPAGPFEDRVFDALVSLPDVEAKNSNTLQSRKLLLRFSAAWSLLSPESQRQALPRVIREIAWDADTCQVSVVLDEAALERYTSEPEKPGKRVRKRTTRGTR